MTMDHADSAIYPLVELVKLNWQSHLSSKWLSLKGTVHPVIKMTYFSTIYQTRLF